MGLHSVGLRTFWGVEEGEEDGKCLPLWLTCYMFSRCWVHLTTAPLGSASSKVWRLGKSKAQRKEWGVESREAQLA